SGPGPVFGGYLDDDGRELFGLGKSWILEVNDLNDKWRLFLARPDRPNALLEAQVSGSFDVSAWGREIVALDDGYILRWIPGDGSYVVLRFHPATATASASLQANTNIAGTEADFRRGARLVNLGSGQLLTWVPGESGYRIRRYHFGDGAKG